MASMTRGSVTNGQFRIRARDILVLCTICISYFILSLSLSLFIICMYVRTYVCMYVCITCVYIYTYMYVCMYVCMQVGVYIYIYIYVHICIFEFITSCARGTCFIGGIYRLARDQAGSTFLKLPKHNLTYLYIA